MLDLLVQTRQATALTNSKLILMRERKMNKYNNYLCQPITIEVLNLLQKKIEKASYEFNKEYNIEFKSSKFKF